MNLKVLFMLIFYYSILSIFFLASGSPFGDAGFTNENPLNDTQLQEHEIDEGGFFLSGIDFTRYLGLITIGIGLGAGVPSWFTLIFAVWQTGLLVFSIGFVISSIWDG